MEVKNLTPEVGSFEIKEGVIYYDLGSVTRKASKTFTLFFEDKKHKAVHAGCPACTRAHLTQKDEGLEINITYTAIDSRGIVNKIVTETFEDSTKQIIKFTAKIF